MDKLDGVVRGSIAEEGELVVVAAVADVSGIRRTLVELAAFW